MPTILDLHVHTRVGSHDSRIDGHEVLHIEGLDGVVLTEHRRRWSGDEFALLQAEGYLAFNAREVETRYGHVVVIGVDDEDLRFSEDVEQLRQRVSNAGGVMVLAHPFRHFPGSWNLLFPQSRDHWRQAELAEWTPERLASHPVFELVDAVEVLNSGCTPAQNRLAAAVARAAGLPGVGASDAHDVTFIGRCATEFEARITHERDLLDAIRTGACRAVHRVEGGFEAAGK
jgi:predicted metal-dependent phosphoesterase TrpH